MIVAGLLSPIEEPLTWLLETLHESAGLPWAWAIVALTVIVRMLLVPLTVKQIHSMQRMQRHMPELKELQQRYKHDKNRQREEMMRFYRENQINPASSCIPVVIQIPIFFALYFVLRDFEKEVFPDYPNSDLGWLGVVPNITDGITAHWSGFLLLTVYVVSQVSSLAFTPTTMTRGQRILMMSLPLVFVFFIVDPPGSTVFPVGLLIYWMTTNLWTVGQGLVTRRLAPKTPPLPRRTSRTPARAETASGDGAEREAAPAPKAAAGGSAPRRVKRKKKKKARR